MRRKRGPGPPWFGPKLGGIPGLSFMPITWQGWALTAAFVVVTAGSAILPVSGAWHAAIFLACIAAFIVVGRTCYDGTKEPS
jgi:hypothetical protein